MKLGDARRSPAHSPREDQLPDVCNAFDVSYDAMLDSVHPRDDAGGMVSLQPQVGGLANNAPTGLGGAPRQEYAYRTMRASAMNGA